MAKVTTLLFENEACGRCGGTGHHSFCQRYGTICFGCGGRGFRLTKRGSAAQAYYNDILPTKLPLALVPGDRIMTGGITNGGDPYSSLGVVLEAPSLGEPYTQSGSVNGVPYERTVQYARVLTRDGAKQRCDNGIDPAKRVTVHPTRGEYRESLRSIALAYQATLTKTGTPPKPRARRQAKREGAL